jgi:hypothetical protein
VESFYLCPCSQKRTLLFSEYLDQHLLLRLPHRQLVFPIPKALRIYFRHDQRLFGSVSSLLAAGSPDLRGAAVVA